MDAPKIKKVTDEKTALAKAEHYCAYQERAQQDVRDKLYEWGAWPQMVESVIVQLIESGHLNEERFAKAYVTGKLRQNNWGRIKIKLALKQKRVSDPLIKKALATIDPDEYLKILEKIIEKKSRSLTEKHPLKRRYKLQQYALSRGFEGDMVGDVLRVNK